MKKLYSTLAAFLAIAAFNAQVSVTYQVDITDYLANGNTLGANGMRIGGNFAAFGGTVDGNAMVDWSPSNAISAMTDMGDNIWSITVDYPSASVGATQLFKFVNNDWGTNEGTDPANTIGADGCGSDDGAGNVNRQLTIPASNLGLQYCFDACFTCAGGDPVFVPVGLDQVVKLSGLNVGPNPAQDEVTFTFNLDGRSNVRLSIIDILGSEVSVVRNQAMNAGQHRVEYDLQTLSNGTYLYRLEANGSVLTGKLIKF